MSYKDLNELKHALSDSASNADAYMGKLVLIGNIIDEYYSSDSLDGVEDVAIAINLSLGYINLLREELEEVGRVLGGCVSFVDDYERSLEILRDDEKRRV